MRYSICEKHSLEMMEACTRCTGEFIYEQKEEIEALKVDNEALGEIIEQSNFNIVSFIARMKQQTGEIEALKAEVKSLRDWQIDVLAVACSSQGIAGYHLNGDIADWEEFEFITEGEEDYPVVEETNREESK